MKAHTQYPSRKKSSKVFIHKNKKCTVQRQNILFFLGGGGYVLSNLAFLLWSNFWAYALEKCDYINL